MILQFEKRLRSLLGKFDELPEFESFEVNRKKHDKPSIRLPFGSDAGEIQKSIKKIQNHFLSLQRENHWEGRVYDNPTITSEYIMFLRFLGLLDEKTKLQASRAILDAQLPDGTWNLYYNGPSNHSANVESYFALKICGVSKDHPQMKKAFDRIVEGGGIRTTRVFTKIHLCLFGEYPWESIPAISPELMLLPQQAPIHIYEFSSWSRAVIVPLLIIFDHKPVCNLEENEKIPELHTASLNPIPLHRKIRNISQVSLFETEQVFKMTQQLVKFYEKSPIKPLRKKALELAENWIIEHQDPKGNWGGIFPAYANSILALRLRGYPLEHPYIQKGLQALRTYAEERPDYLRMQSTISPVWDTAIGMFAMTESGYSPNTERMIKARNWLVEKQITQRHGDWIHKSLKPKPGGWPFEHENDLYPDLDDTSMAILALLPHEKSDPKISTAIERGIEWMFGMQGSDGGWGAFDRDNNKHILNEIPFADLKSLLDPSTPDITGHVLEALGQSGIHCDHPNVINAIEFLKNTQEKDGSWFGRWGVNYVYGTSAVLCGLQTVGCNMNQTWIMKAVHWLQSIQNQDGGWGESCESYDHGQYAPLYYSTPSQTAWGLLGLLSCDKSSPEIIERGIKLLLKTQNEDGSWDEPEWTATGFPSHFYLRYDYYRLYFPLLALARALRCKLNCETQSSTNA
jgi:squalene-hopene/tetraprenyl-beta-curcumene cyclase